MLINGRTRQACSALVEKLLAEQPDEIELRPMSKFPVLRDLLVNRRRLFRALERVKAWIPVDGYYDAGPGPRQSAEQQEQAYPLMQCMSCGCCLEACPQYGKVETGATCRRVGRSAARPRTGPPTTPILSVPTRSAKRCSTIQIPPAR